MLSIRSYLSPEERKKAQLFLDRIRPLLRTNDVTISQNHKNDMFDKEYNLTHAEKIKLLESLTVEECTKIEPNDNPRYPNSEIYFFLKNVQVIVYGEPATPCVYIKMYLAELPNYDSVIVISFHKEGMHD